MKGSTVAESGGQQHENRALNLKVRSMNFHLYAHQDAVVPLQRATRVSSVSMAVSGLTGPIYGRSSSLEGDHPMDLNDRTWCWRADSARLTG